MSGSFNFVGKGVVQKSLGQLLTQAHGAEIFVEDWSKNQDGDFFKVYIVRDDGAASAHIDHDGNVTAVGTGHSPSRVRNMFKRMEAKSE